MSTDRRFRHHAGAGGRSHPKARTAETTPDAGARGHLDISADLRGDWDRSDVASTAAGLSGALAGAADRTGQPDTPDAPDAALAVHAPDAANAPRAANVGQAAEDAR
jgi:hypothetical protein